MKICYSPVLHTHVLVCVKVIVVRNGTGFSLYHKTLEKGRGTCLPPAIDK